MTWNSRSMDVFEADGTIGPGDILHTLEIRSWHNLNCQIVRMRIVLRPLNVDPTILYYTTHLKHSYTLCPFFSWTGRHMLHFSQWKNLSAPPIRQIPQPEQWNWFLSSSSNKLHSKHVYFNKLILNPGTPMCNPYFSKPYPAVLALGLHRLSHFAQRANQLRHLFSVHRMILLLVVTKPTSVHLLTAWCLEK